MAFAPLISLDNTIRRILYDWEEPFDYLNSLKDVIRNRLDDSSGCSKRLEALDAQIRDEVHKFEDALESHWLDKLLSQSEDLGSPRDDGIFLKEVWQQIKSLKEAVEKILESVDESDNTSAVQEEEEEDQEEEDLIDSAWMDWKNIFTLVGMPGTCRTILARSVFNDPDICNYFDRRAWVTVGPNCQYKEIVKSILVQIDPQGSHDSLLRKEGQDVYYYLGKAMRKQRKRCLIIMDDVNPLELKFFWRHPSPPPWPSDYNFLVTHREERYGFHRNIYALRVLSKEESWDLLCKLVFDPQLCPPELVKAGKKIAANCKGLAVEIAKTALFLSSTEKTPEHWDNVAAEMETSVSEDEYDEMSEISKEFTCSHSTDSSKTIIELLGLSYAIDYISR